MRTITLTTGPLLLAVLLVLAGAAAALVRWGALGGGRAVLTAALRAVVQLTAVSALITVVLRHVGATAAFILVMVVVATLTAGRRITGGGHRAGWWAAVPIVAGVAPVLALILGSTLVPATPVAVLPVAGILIGGAMTATSLAGRRALDELHTRRGEHEAALSLGLLPREAALEICRPASALALVPALDQTRTVGLVTLPGAFVGVLLGGAGPVQAGATQLLVLVALLAVEATAVLVTVELVATARLHR
ncbi:ABC transporter permease [Goodfellowiella coeruleoviolacea]|uniref:ABC transport system permease protein n=1 Tax=Goodfellowiella coeruleoviolacea TaxID=334858 RepID=A0AAE3GKR0_9PSEU|nr:ABC transporter permease [Goodfellowiella coeruleoviolacea]MCP2169413.1 putative ABC transport system permease protein [Goodfellowiella coeruleoviolacea]